ncbi:unnamed protein product [Aphanomyces euteiches]
MDCNSATANKAVLEPVEVANSVVCTLHTDTRPSDPTQARETLHACQGKIAMRSRYACPRDAMPHSTFVQDPMPFQFAALRTAFGEDDLAPGPMEEQQRLHLVEVITRYGDVVLAASLPSLLAQVHALQESQANALQLRQQLGQAVAAHPQDAAPATTDEPKKVRNLVPQERPREVVDPRLRKQTAIHLHVDDRPRQSERSNPRLRVYERSRGESPSRSELFRRIPKTFEEAVEIALKEKFSQASAQEKSAGSDQWDMDVSSMEQFPQREAYRVPASAPPSQRPCFECNQLGHFARDCPRRGGTPRLQQAKTRYPAVAPQGQAQSPRRFGRSPGSKGGPNRRVNFRQGNGGSQ